MCSPTFTCRCRRRTRPTSPNQAIHRMSGAHTSWRFGRFLAPLIGDLDRRCPPHMTRRQKIPVGVAVCGGLFFVGLLCVRSLRYGSCTSELRQIYGARQEWARQYNKGTNDIPTLADLQPLVFPGRTNLALVFRSPEGGTYAIGRLGEPPTCSVGGPEHTLP